MYVRQTTLRALIRAKSIIAIHASLLAFVIASASGCATPAPPPPQPGPIDAEVLRVIRANPAVILDALQSHQEQTALAAQRAEEQALRTRINALDLNKLAEGAPTRGAPSKQFLLFAFSDFQCPYCARANPAIQQFVEKYKNDVTLVYKHLPLIDIHPQAEPAARAAWAAHQQGKFWAYHDRLFEDPQNLDEVRFLSIARDLALDLKQFNRDRKSDAATQSIQQDINLANQLQVTGTPFFLMQREPLSGALPLEALEDTYQKLKHAGAAPKAAPPAASMPSAETGKLPNFSGDVTQLSQSRNPQP